MSRDSLGAGKSRDAFRFPIGAVLVKLEEVYYS